MGIINETNKQNHYKIKSRPDLASGDFQPKPYHN